MKLRMNGDGRKGVALCSLNAATVSLSGVLLGQITYAMTTSFAMAGTVVGMVLFASRVFDGITDILAGFIIDKCHFKLGKARPFDLFNIPMWLFLVLCFEIPALNTVGKVIYLFAVYNLCQSVCYTFVSVSSAVRLKRTFVEEVRAKVLAAASMMSALVATVAGILIPLLIDAFESRPHGWVIIMSFFAAPSIIMTLLNFLLLPEMEEPAEEETTGKAKTNSMKESVKALFQNPYLICIIIIGMANNLSLVMGGTASTYYFRYNMGQLTLASVISLFTVAGYVFLVAMPAMTKKIGNRKTAMVAYVMVFVGNLAKLIMPTNIVWLIICTIFAQVGITLAVSVRDMLLMDGMHYGKLKTGFDGDGIYSSAKGFSDKISNGIGPLLCGIILDFAHFDGTVEVQTVGAMNAILILYMVVPALLALIAFVAAYFCKLEDKIKEMEQA